MDLKKRFPQHYHNYRCRVSFYLISTNISSADLQEDIISKLTSTKTMSFSFNQKIAEKEDFPGQF